jgi:sulfhydrogenase subunit delta
MKNKPGKTKKVIKRGFQVAIYDLTDCEGCEVEIVSLREKLLDVVQAVDVIDWRLIQERKRKGPFFLSLIEGSPITKTEIDTLKQLRQNSKYLIALGACASLAGIPGIIKKEERKKWYKKIYGEKYKPKGIDALPLQAFVKVDFFIHGCPVNPEELMRVLEELFSGKKPKYRPYSVCFECKSNENKCRLKHNMPCLGPIAQGGCDAICVSGGSPCYGCFGFRENADLEGLVSVIKKLKKGKTKISNEEINDYFTMFLRQTPEYQKRIKNLLR